MRKNAVFTRIEVLVIAVIGVTLFVLLTSTGSHAKRKSRAISCMNNLSQLGRGFVQYLNDNDDVMFSQSKIGQDAWPNKMQRHIYVREWSAFRSPFDPATDARPRTTNESNGVVPVSYGINVALFDTKCSDWESEPSKIIFAAPAIEKTSTSPLAWQADAFSNQNCKVTPGGSGAFGTHATRSDLNVLFSDMHVESMPCTKFSDSTSESGKARWFPK